MMNLAIKTGDFQVYATIPSRGYALQDMNVLMTQHFAVLSLIEQGRSSASFQERLTPPESFIFSTFDVFEKGSDLVGRLKLEATN